MPEGSTLPLEVLDWPLQKPGDEKFFGYLVAVGVLPGDWSDGPEGLSRYADFAYSGSYDRYRLPNDMRLVEQLHKTLWTNLGASFSEGGVYGKFWIEKTNDGYSIFEP